RLEGVPQPHRHSRPGGSLPAPQAARPVGAVRVFLAGATEMMGRGLLPKLTAAGHEVVAMTRDAERADRLRQAGAEPVVCGALGADPPRRERPWLAFLRRHW